MPPPISTTLGNEESDRLAKEGAQKIDADPLPLDVPKEYNLQGVKLATLIQSLAYRRIREQRTLTTGSRATTEQNMLMVKQTIAAYGGSQETDEAIWKGIRR